MEEPVGEAYRTLIQLALEVCDTFILVKRDQMALETEGVELLERLQPYHIKTLKEDDWPGTKLFGHYADVHYFRCAQEAAAILLEYTSGLYSWVQPRLPDDLCFLKNGEPWLTNTAHEHMSFLDTGVEEELVRLERSGLLIRDLSGFNWSWDAHT
ncbi:hypothetical protein NST84_05495 [Paenibacillus sp. FSL R7-0345]|uniref:hypothetical protein n=1 Tax=Paenibacillus sp. FSL R7-0345 TaxID=2954535 RepID=UPI00315A0185